MKPLTLDEAHYVAHELARRLMTYDEPIPAFETRYAGTLEGCLKLPFQTVGGKPAYFRFTRRAAVLFYCVIKDHPFLNGNKRMAVTLTMVFCYQNGRWLDINPHKLYELACAVAVSPPSIRGEVMEVIVALFNKTITKEIPDPTASSSG